MNRLLAAITLCSLLTFLVFSCRKGDEPGFPPQGYIVFNNSDTVVFNHLSATRAISDTETIYRVEVIAANYPNGDITVPPTTSVKFSLLSNSKKGVFNDKRCSECAGNPTLEVTTSGNGTYNSGTCYLDENTFNTFTVELFHNEKANAETIVFTGTLCQPTSDTTFKTIKVKGVMQDAPF